MTPGSFSITRSALVPPGAARNSAFVTALPARVTPWPDAVAMTSTLVSLRALSARWRTVSTGCWATAGATARVE
ncbi:MAG: hypothetical protein M3466_06770 [Gemmatimonadota bacterium]|nr:hypothetical protein [Gemmatimonadota bacterium]